ncbi:hypothetical protein Pmar_PMAR025954 [Perkinsus marinus ATCC 50983]|uniref:Uncharacterized protein n=1 Tax=Perkinsus marinus (strain ATCC 50983 / TXsc) TaxID=423536 RepID=C5L1H5_PERM5|nr:hypothetical protein Pmar_PMAR025954 [Perkinsus marinus ATCC 50983]EER09402.1 hypothetical protein Pmar_PMAR025954 [Perkinsus marinus ATCC 50983]|eukprot:XP_002777586.1 hypothetical protein Pmar_PMAR025954 [Perkinsus marinus ATCC 50983]
MYQAVCTFAPNIYSRRGHKPGQEGAVGNRLLRAAEVSKAKIEEKRKAIESARMREATFAPKITPYPSNKNRDPTGVRQRAGTRQSPSIQGMYGKDGMAAKQCHAEEAFKGTPPVGPDRAPMQGGDSAGVVSHTRQSASRQSPDRATINR